MKNKLLQITFILFVFVSSCKKEEGGSGPSLGKKDHLIAGNWKMYLASVNPGLELGDSGLVTNLMAIMPACATDNIARFKSDNTGYFDEGPVKCDESDPQIIDFNYELSNDGTKLTMRSKDIYEIETLNENYFIYTQKVNGDPLIGGKPGTIYTFRVGYKH